MRILPDLSSSVAHVLAACDSPRRFRCGVLHILHKALPQRSIVKHIDNASNEHLNAGPVQLFLQAVLQDMRPDLAPFTIHFIRTHFRLALLAVRRYLTVVFHNVPGLRALASMFIAVEQLEADVQEALHTADNLHPCIAITPLVAGWNVFTFAKCALDVLPALPRPLEAYTAMLHALHVCFSRGTTVSQMLSRFGLRACIVEQLHSAFAVRRRLRKSRVRAAINQCTEFERTALHLSLLAFRRHSRYRLTQLPNDWCEWPVPPRTSTTFLTCAVCCTCRSAVGGGARGASRCLYDYETAVLSCGRKGNTANLCANTPLLQIDLSKAVLHIKNSVPIARCTLCGTFYHYTLHAWSKGVPCCTACSYKIADDGNLSASCPRCNRPYVSRVQLQPRSPDVFVRSRQCLHCQ